MHYNKQGLCKLIFAASALLSMVGCTQVGSLTALQDKPRSQDLVTRRAPKDNSFIAHGGYIKNNGTLMNASAKSRTNSSAKVRLPSDDFGYGMEEKPETVGSWLIYSFGGGSNKDNPSSLADLFSDASDDSEATDINNKLLRSKRRDAVEAAQPKTFGEWFYGTFNMNNIARPAIFAAPMQWSAGEGSAAPDAPHTQFKETQKRAPRGNADFFAPRISSHGPLDEGSAEDASYYFERLAPAPVPSVVASETIQGKGHHVLHNKYEARMVELLHSDPNNIRRRPKLNQSAMQANAKAPLSDGAEKTLNSGQPKVNLGKAVRAFRHLANRYGLS